MRQKISTCCCCISQVSCEKRCVSGMNFSTHLTNVRNLSRRCVYRRCKPGAQRGSNAFVEWGQKKGTQEMRAERHFCSCLNFQGCALFWLQYKKWSHCKMVQGWPKEWSLRCVNPDPVSRISVDRIIRKTYQQTKWRKMAKAKIKYFWTKKFMSRFYLTTNPWL